MSETIDSSSGLTTKRIVELAYYIFLDRGGEHGHDMDDWLTAEREILKRSFGADDQMDSPKSNAAGEIPENKPV